LWLTVNNKKAKINLNETKLSKIMSLR
jgi:hypothetical protein